MNTFHTGCRMMMATVALILFLVMVSRYLWSKRTAEDASVPMKEPSLDWAPPSREKAVERLKSEAFDLLVIGGGSTGAGCALDAAARGLRVALVDSGDFGSGTSSKSTKLVHGGVRYLAKAVSNLDWSQYSLVRQALNERDVVFRISPYLTNSIKIMVPIYSRILVPYYYFGLKLYDWLSGLKSLGKSYFIGKRHAAEAFPHINRRGLHGAMVYHDGQQHDVRNNIMLVVTAAYYGATAVNHLMVKSLVLRGGKAVGAVCVDSITGLELSVRAAGVINSTGNLADKLRKMENPDAGDIMVQSSGTHIVIPRKYTPRSMGFLDPNTGDGRVAFFMPWMGKTLVGATDNRTSLGCGLPTEGDLDFLVHEVRAYTSDAPKLKKRDVLAVWTGMRPLVKDPEAVQTEAIVRRHYIGAEKNGILTVTGGKWSIYRIMAEEAIDMAVKLFSLRTERPCMTKHIKILGSHGYTEKLHLEIRWRLKVSKKTARHLARFYGARALKLADYIEDGGAAALSGKYPYLAEEVAYCIDNEFAVRVCDVLCNRLMLGLLDVREAHRCMKRVLEIFKTKCHWDADRCKMEEAEATRLLNSYGLSILAKADGRVDAEPLD